MKNKFRALAVGLLFGIAGLALAVPGAFNLFKPATGILKGNASTYITTAAVATDIGGLWPCSGGSPIMQYDGTCTSGGTGPSPANPTASLGLTAINGSASTYMRSDAAPALDQTIVPTWTGIHSFTSTGFGDSSAVRIRAAIPHMEFYRTSATADNHIWDVGLSSATWSVRAIDDAQITFATGLSVTRGSGAVIATVGLGNGTDLPAITFNGSQGTTTTVLHGNASGGPTFGAVVNADLANSSITINGTSVSLGGTRTLSLASSDFANQGTTTTVLHGNGAGNPSFGAVSLSADVTGTLADGSLSANVALYNANMSSFSSGTLADARLSANVALYNASMASFTSGTLADARLSTNVALLSGGQNFSVAPTISSKNICLADGTNCPGGSGKRAFARISVSGAACSVVGGASNLNVSSCSYSSAGTYTVTVAASFSAAPICTVSTLTQAMIGSSNPGSSTSVGVQIWNLSSTGPITWTATDPTGFNLDCVGT